VLASALWPSPSRVLVSLLCPAPSSCAWLPARVSGHLQLAGRDPPEVFPMAGSLLNPSRGRVRSSKPQILPRRVRRLDLQPCVIDLCSPDVSPNIDLRAWIRRRVSLSGGRAHPARLLSSTMDGSHLGLFINSAAQCRVSSTSVPAPCSSMAASRAFRCSYACCRKALCSVRFRRIVVRAKLLAVDIESVTRALDTVKRYVCLCPSPTVTSLCSSRHCSPSLSSARDLSLPVVASFVVLWS
jgi:hypothetical protein